MGVLKSPPRRPGVPRRWSAGLFLVPVLLQFGSFLPLFAFSWWLARVLSIPWTKAPVREHPNGLLWFVLFLLAGWVFQLGGVMLGFSLNAWILRRHLGLRWEAIPETGLCPRLVARWLEHRAAHTKTVRKPSKKNDPLFDPQLDHPLG
jgi:hypothetical protein